MNCSEFESHLSEYVDGEIASQARKDFVKHKTGCPGCKDLLTDFKKALNAIHTLPERQTSPDFNRRLYQKIDESNQVSMLKAVRNLFPDNLFSRYAVATAFAVFVAFFIYSTMDETEMLNEPVQHSVLPPPSLNIQQPPSSQQEILPDQQMAIQTDSNDTNSANVKDAPSSTYEGRIQYVNGSGN